MPTNEIPVTSPQIVLALGNEFAGFQLYRISEDTWSVNLVMFWIFQLILHISLAPGFLCEIQFFFYRISVGFSFGSWHNVE